MLLVGVVLKSVPVIVTVVPMGPLVGEKEEMVGIVTVTLKAVPLVVELQPTVTEIVPVVALVGTAVVILVEVLAVTTEVMPLNLTMLLADVGSKSVPVIVTKAPIVPLLGEKELIVGTNGLGVAVVFRTTDTVLLPALQV